jgi:hypothetical protein
VDAMCKNALICKNFSLTTGVCQLFGISECAIPYCVTCLMIFLLKFCSFHVAVVMLSDVAAPHGGKIIFIRKLDTDFLTVVRLHDSRIS